MHKGRIPKSKVSSNSFLPMLKHYKIDLIDILEMILLLEITK